MIRNFVQRTARFYGEARQRAKRRKSLWNFLLIPFCLGPAFGLWYALFRLVWCFHVAIYPQHELREFWQDGISFKSGAPSFLMVFALMPGALVFGFMLGNSLLWLIAPIRRIFDAEAKSYPGTNFQDAMRGLFMVGIWALPIGLVIAFSAAYFLKSLR